MTLRIAEYNESAGKKYSIQSQIFSRTNQFRFADRENGFLQTRTATLDALGTRLSLVRSTGHQIDLTEFNNISILMPGVGDLNVATHDSEFRCKAGEALLFGPNRRKTRTNNDGENQFEGNVALLPLKAFSETEDRTVFRTIGPLLQSGLHVSAKEELFVPFLKYFDYFCSLIFEGSVAATNPKLCEHSVVLLYELLHELALGLSARLSDEKITSSGAHYVVQAEEHMRANLDQQISISEIAAAIGVSQRSLQLAFRELRGTSPRETLAMMRLEAVHKRLMSGDNNSGVTDLALEFGVANVGRFARSYQKFYGEKPSHTRRRAKTRWISKQEPRVNSKN